MTISQLARQAGISARALRHYEEVGLLLPRRSGNGYREYATDDLDRVQRIRSLLGLGLSLKQVGDLLGDEACPRRLVDLRLAQVDRDLRDLTAVREKLVRLQSSMSMKRSPFRPPGETGQLDLLMSLEVINMLEQPENDPIMLELGTELVPLVNLFGQKKGGLLDALRRVRGRLRKAGIYLPGVRVRDTVTLGAEYRLVIFGREHRGGPIYPGKLLAVGADFGEPRAFPGIGRKGVWVEPGQPAEGCTLLRPLDVIIRHAYHLFRAHAAQLGLMAPTGNDHPEDCACLDCVWLSRGRP